MSTAEVVTSAAAVAPPPAVNAHTQRLLQDPIVPMLLRMAWPNILIMLAQASTGLIETYWISRLGTEALAGMALVFPAVMLMQMISAGAMGGGISSAIARALGAGKQADANALVLHAVLINVALGIFFSVLMLTCGRFVYGAMGGSGGVLEAALIYSNVIFGGNVLLWVMNGLASVIRGTGNMLVPAIVTCVGVVLLVPLSPLLIFGWGPVPAFGIAGAGIAMLLFYLGGMLALGWYIVSGRNQAHFRRAPLRWSLFQNILRIGGLSSLNALQTNVLIAMATGLVATTGGVAAVAGFGTAARLEYLLIPIVFGLGAPMVALVGTNIGAGQRERALRIALTGAAIAFALTELVGLFAAIWPTQWLKLFTDDEQIIATGSEYLRIAGPFYGFFGLGLSLYFASQGAGRLFWPLTGGVLRIAIAIGGGWLALELTQSVTALFGALALAIFVYGTLIGYKVYSGVWFKPDVP